MKNGTGQIIRLVILLALILTSCTGCRQSPLLKRIVYVPQAEQINLNDNDRPPNHDKRNTAAAQEKNEQNANDKADSDQQAIGRTDTQPGTTRQGNGDSEYGAGDKSGEGALGQIVSDEGEPVEVPESVANVTTVSQDTGSPHWKSSRTDRSKYTGAMENGLFNGQGTYSWADGDKYTGQWEDDLFKGQGTYYWANGDKYEGEWQDDMFQGHGIYTWASGSSYEGEWKDGVKEGQGTYSWANGDKYTGTWKAGVKDGQGTYTWADGSIYTGAWKYGVREGQGTYHGAGGTIYEGWWSNDKFTARQGD